MLYVNFPKLLAKGVTDFSRIDHSTFEWESLRWLLAVAAKRKPEIFFLGFPEEVDFNDVLLFWADNFYPGKLVGTSGSKSASSIDTEAMGVSKDAPSYSIEGEGPISERDAKLAILFLKD